MKLPRVVVALLMVPLLVMMPPGLLVIVPPVLLLMVPPELLLMMPPALLVMLPLILIMPPALMIIVPLLFKVTRLPMFSVCPAKIVSVLLDKIFTSGFKLKVLVVSSSVAIVLKRTGMNAGADSIRVCKSLFTFIQSPSLYSRLNLLGYVNPFNKQEFKFLSRYAFPSTPKSSLICIFLKYALLVRQDCDS